MRKAAIYFFNEYAGVLEEIAQGKEYYFRYLSEYEGPPISLNMPVVRRTYTFHRFPPFFDGLLPEGQMLAGLLKQRKIDANDYFTQLVTVGADLVGAVTVKAIQ